MAVCRTCQHPDVERINMELALAPNVHTVAARYDIPRRSLARHRRQCLTQQEIARMRGMSPSQLEVDIDELARKGGQDAYIGLSRLLEECKAQADRCDRIGQAREAAIYRKLQLDIYDKKLKIAAMYPGRKTVTNNNLVLGDVGMLFDLVDATLRPFPEARRAVADAFARQAQMPPVLEHAA